MKRPFSSLLSIVVLFVLVLSSQAVDKTNPGPWPTLKIGQKLWSAKNFHVFTCHNGDSIFHAVSDEEWIKAGEEDRPAWCYCQNDTTKDKVFGKLYNFFAVLDVRNLAPKGWHIATHEEWKTIMNLLGGEDFAVGKLCEYAIAPISSLTCQFAGLRDYDATYSWLGATAAFWIGTAYDETRGWDRQIMSNSKIVTTAMDFVRCIND